MPCCCCFRHAFHHLSKSGQSNVSMLSYTISVHNCVPYFLHRNMPFRLILSTYVDLGFSFFLKALALSPALFLTFRVHSTQQNIKFFCVLLLLQFASSPFVYFSSSMAVGPMTIASFSVYSYNPPSPACWRGCLAKKVERYSIRSQWNPILIEFSMKFTISTVFFLSFILSFFFYCPPLLLSQSRLYTRPRSLGISKKENSRETVDKE